MTTEPLRDELVSLSDFAWHRLRARIDGLTDSEYLWRPVPDCWTIRPGPHEGWMAEGAWPPPDPAPVTTIAWRLSHLVTDDRFRAWLGLPPAPERRERFVPPTAAEAIAAVDTARSEMRDDLADRSDADLWVPIGPVGGSFSASSRVAWVLHALDEVIHHGAEVALLRDLYLRRQRFAPWPGPSGS